MTPLEQLNRKALQLEREGRLSEEEYRTYTVLLAWLEFSTAYIGDRLPIKDARPLLEALRGE